ncbi:DUF4369 domain-containing protein [Pareuzebyella sediminis]|uniref:DUF4369 domain-containing protein n=1 Tax=Pareuzebyella sediminis TaxID=2607998 RepID=UPI0011ECA8A1|nr:DUF4369 domain-containing protein [Pareuzebyella sediminis]
MKYFPLTGLILLILVACATETDKTMTVTGTVKGLKKGTLYLQHMADSTLVTVDSLKIDGNGDFTFKTELESPELYYLYLDKADANDINDRITFFGEPGTITINTSWNTFDLNAKIEGSATQEKFEEYKKTMSRFNMKNLEIVQNVTENEVALDSLAIDSLQRLSDKNLKRSYAYALNFALSNKDSYIAPYIALMEVSDANVVYLDSIYNSLTPAIADSKYGRQLKAYLEDIKKSR